jgi:hypothetical protein
MHIINRAMMIITIVVRNDNRTLGDIDGVGVGESVGGLVGIFVGASVRLLVGGCVGEIKGVAINLLHNVPSLSTKDMRYTPLFVLSMDVVVVD